MSCGSLTLNGVGIEIRPLTDEFLINYYTSSLKRCHMFAGIVGVHAVKEVADFASDLTDCSRLRNALFFEQVHSSSHLIDRFRRATDRIQACALNHFLKGYRFSVKAHKHARGSKLLDPITPTPRDPIKALRRRIEVGMKLTRQDTGRPAVHCRLEYEKGKGNIRSDSVVFRLFMPIEARPGEHLHVPGAIAAGAQ